VTGASSYTVELSIKDSLVWSVTDTVTSLAKTFTGLRVASYVMRVRANFANGFTPWAFYTTPVAAPNAKTLFADTFNGEAVAGTNLESHVPTNGGAAWALGAGGTGSAQVVGSPSQTVRQSALTTGVQAYSIGQQAIGTGVFAEGVLDIKSNAAAYSAALLLRSDNVTNGLDAFCVIYNGTNMRLGKWVANAFTALATYAVVLPVGSQPVIRMECEAGAQRMYLDGALVGSAADAFVGGGDHMGIRMQNTGTAGGDQVGPQFNYVAFGVL
jgi:hypothetical protein